MSERLSKMPANTVECRFCGHTSKNGTGRSAHERHCEKNPAYTPSKEKLREQERLANPNHLCPECAAEGISKGFTNPGSLGTHRRSVHGVVGKLTTEAKVPCTYVDPEGKACSFRGKSEAGMLTHYARKHVNRGSKSLVPAVVNGNGNGHTPAELRRTFRTQIQNRADLVAIVKIAYPHGIDTHDDQALDGDLNYIAMTAQVLDSR